MNEQAQPTSTSQSNKDETRTQAQPLTSQPKLSLGLPRGHGRSKPGSNSGGSTNGKPPQSQTAKQRADIAIRSTDNDAMGSRLSAIMQRYIPGDPFTPMLASNEASTSATISRRSPIINIGTYLRSRSIDRLVQNFLIQSDSPKQIISLGAGSDSRFWRLQSDPTIKTLSHYFELDFSNLTTAKVARIRRRQELATGIGQHPWISEDQTCLQTERYSLIACDLRTLPDDQKAISLLEKQLDTNKETLIIAECVLAYLSPQESNALLSFLGKLLKRPSALCYEMCVAGDDTAIRDAPPSRFGSVMLSNLQSRSLDMPGARAFSTLSSHKDRFQIGLGQSDTNQKGKGFAQTLKNVWQSIEEEEKQRLSRLEGLDEIEELEILLAHYAISWYAFDGAEQATFVSTRL